jgi:hypothetical protein
MSEWTGRANDKGDEPEQPMWAAGTGTYDSSALTIADQEANLDEGKNIDGSEKASELKPKDSPAMVTIDDEADLDEAPDRIDSTDDSKLTRLSKAPGDHTPRGRTARIEPQMRQEHQRGLARENEAADLFARNGYDIEHQPAIPDMSKRPDYLIENKIFDYYAPSTTMLEAYGRP